MLAGGCASEPAPVDPVTANNDSQENVPPASHETSSKPEILMNPEKLTDADWKARLNETQYYVTRKKGTEPPFNNEYWDSKVKGVYRCVCCNQPLFDSETKYESGTGWPSFYQPIEPAAVKEEADRKLLYTRTEILCSHCDAHLGHVFEDGPEPTGLRYCMNSASLLLEPEEEGSGSE